ncbi:hypothetical protein LBMAG56_40920 [Verrucomicrobiota bacterium]|nr:hypothetical protein LBMAG56_40920 [Verrucomicrobiota bacterium]
MPDFRRVLRFGWGPEPGRDAQRSHAIRPRPEHAGEDVCGPGDAPECGRPGRSDVRPRVNRVDLPTTSSRSTLLRPGTGALRAYRRRLACEWRGVLAPAIGPGGETPPELAGEDACGTEGVEARGIYAASACERPGGCERRIAFGR